MDLRSDRTLEIILYGVEIDTFLDIIDDLKHKSKRIGFSKSFNKDQLRFIDYMHENLIGDEKNKDTSK